ncbi:related to allantoate permease [Phialocephala subalpina]|uniref:Related to allantoate permease n=1 Tax=Phialocephala subalpina TaxID=576137 RepID=A0A1L7XT40_9HELO|nr:related to allantoate permease [Phialocephala subalpina]
MSSNVKPSNMGSTQANMEAIALRLRKSLHRPPKSLVQRQHLRALMCISVPRKAKGLIGSLSGSLTCTSYHGTNIGNAKIAGLQKDLHHMSAGRYNACLTIFFIPYSLLEPVCNVFLKRWKPSVFIPVTVVIWGVVMTSMGFVENWSGLMAARWVLGVAEAGLFPGVNYFLSCWYKRDEIGVRTAIFFSAAAISGSFGGLLAAVIEKLEGRSGKPGWSWIFIIEGIVTIGFGLMSFFLVHDFPDTATFLDEQDRIRVLQRLKEDQQSSARHESFQMHYIWASLRDWKTWGFMLVYMGTDMPLYAFSLFLPTIIKNIGYTSVHAQLLSVPPYACAAALTIFVGFLADRTRQRGLCNISSSILGIAGFFMLLSTTKPHIQYAGTFLAALGIYPCIPNTISWVSNNTEGVYKRGIVLGLVIGWGHLNGIVSSNIYFKPPRYTVGHTTILAYLTVCLLGGSCLMHFLLKRENAARLAGKRDYLTRGKTEKEVESLGDIRPDFVYTL